MSGDIVYFTGLIEGFGDFCHEHGLQVVTNESPLEENVATTTEVEERTTNDEDEYTDLTEDDVLNAFNSGEIGFTKESLTLADAAERLRCINRMTGMYSVVTLGICCHSSSSELTPFYVPAHIRYYPSSGANRVCDGTQ